MKFLSKIFCLLIVLLVAEIISAQTSLSGIINQYAAVTNIDFCNNKITVDTVTGFSVGDKVLLIQMKGAVIDPTNTSTFGNVLNYANSGNYEVQVIGSIIGNDIVFHYAIKRNYDVAGAVQIVRIPQYNTARVDSVIRALVWTGTKGGVLILEADSLILNDSIDCKGKGYRGAIKINDNNAQACYNNGVGGATDYFCATVDCGGPKGEGAGETAYGFGRGKNANGGGGGDDHNTGGGGGGNYGAGGVGGMRTNTSQFQCPGPAPGDGGIALLYSNLQNKIFMGGGGGAGDENNNQASGGQKGGGICIITANVLAGNGKRINANGNRVQVLAQSDGAGGGGGGGCVLLNVNNISGNLIVTTNGGDGGILDNGGSTTFCFGPGGGGGAGVLWVKGNSIPGNITYIDTGGKSGYQLYIGNSNCPQGSVNGAAHGASGGSLTDLIIPVADTLFVKLTATACCDTTVCPGALVTMTSTANSYSAINYNWSTGATAPSFTQSYNSTTPVNLTVTDIHNCSVTFNFTVTVANHVITTYPCCDTSICPGGTVNMQMVETDTFPLNYLWSNGNNTTGFSEQVFSNTTYTVTISDLNGCSVVKSAQVTTSNLAPNLSVCCDTTVCPGGTVQLTASSTSSTPINFLWSNSSTSATISQQVFSSQSFTVTVSDGNNCSASQTAQVTVANNAPSLNVCCDTSVCTGSTVQLSASSNGVQPLSFSWSNGSTNSTAAQQVFSNTTITVTVTDANHCTASQSAQVTINNTNPPQVIVCCDTIVCSGSSVMLNAAATGVSPFTYSWSSGETSTLITAQVNSTQPFFVTVTDGNGCSAIAAAYVTVPWVNISLTATPDSAVVIGQSVLLDANGNVTYTYAWSPHEGLSNTNKDTTTATPLTVTKYCVTATDVNGCTAEDCYTIELKTPDVKIPDAFTPNNDGVNDVFTIFPDAYSEIYSIRIYNRWGELIYDVNSNVAWDGKYKGKVQDNGAYVCTVTYGSPLNPSVTKSVTKDFLLLK